MGERRQVHVGAHVRDGVAVSDYVQSRPAGAPGPLPPRANRGAHTGALHGIVGDVGAHTPTAQQWQAAISDRDGAGAPSLPEAHRVDGTVDVGRRTLVVAVTHRFTHHHDDQSTAAAEELPSEFDAREFYGLPVPQGAHVDYAAVREAVVAHTRERFDPLVAAGTYGDVAVRSVMVAEWEVVDDPDPKKRWKRQRETWEDGGIAYP